MVERVLLITGGSRGIGAAVARLAGREGYRVAINYVSGAKTAERLVKDIAQGGGAAVAIQADMSRFADVERLFKDVERALGPVTHLVNNAGIPGRSGRLDQADPVMIGEVVNLNVTGAIWVARAAVRRMSTVHGGKGGAIVNISSMAATLGAPGEYTWYAASKGAIDAFTVGLAREVAREGIRVNAVSPGLIETEFHSAGGQPDRVARLSPTIPMGRAGAADEVAAAVLWLLSDASSYVTGANLHVSGGR